MSTQITTSEVIRDTLNRLYALRANIEDNYPNDFNQNKGYIKYSIYIKTLVYHMKKIDSATNTAMAYIVKNGLN